MSKWVQSYGCVRCQQRHYTGQPIYQQHILHQSKHGISYQKAGPSVDWTQTDNSAERTATHTPPAGEDAPSVSPARTPHQTMTIPEIPPLSIALEEPVTVLLQRVEQQFRIRIIALWIDRENDGTPRVRADFGYVH